VAVAISARADDTCAVTSTGGVKCWGRDFGALPVDIAGLTSGVAAIAVGPEHRCALTTVGGMKCWGDNTYGELGNTTPPLPSDVVDVMGLTSGVAAIAAGWTHSCAVTTAGGVKCWGNGYMGQLGNNAAMTSQMPVDVQGLSSNMVSVACGDAFTCARDAAGSLYCWGEDGAYGNLGDSYAAGAGSLVPVDVLYITGSQLLVTGTLHACATTAAMGLECWGYGGYGALGDSFTSNDSVPGPVQGLSSGVVAAGAGLQDTCAVTSAGAVLCWGVNTQGQVGDNSTMQRLVPVPVTGLSSGFVSVAVGDSHACALASTGAVWCWGFNVQGQLGNGGSPNQSPVPVRVSGT
jgi:alpha-tubulin suppressor-like RCC1 family protein